MKILLLLNLLLFQCGSNNDCEILKDIFTNKHVENYLHTYRKEREVLYIVENDLFNCSRKIDEKLEIKILSKKDIRSLLNYVEVFSYKIENDILFLILKYPNEGIMLDIIFNKNTNKIITLNIIEK